MAGGVVLVTGGAGYVGSHTCLRLAEAGFQPVVFDNLSNGHEEFVQWGPLERGDIRDRARLSEIFSRYKPDAVMHFAALIEVGESVKFPGKFYETNVGGAANVVQAAQASGVQAFVFSSTCATYGDPIAVPMAEDHPQLPLNPYGRSKLMTEQVLADLDTFAGMRSSVLRYFNAAGADPQGRVGERHNPETHAVPLLIQAAQGRRPGFSIFGDDYATRDGTAVRDYVHVLDLAEAHVAALRLLLAGEGSQSFNLGTGTGTTVRELIDSVWRVTGRDFPIHTTGRRHGDAAELVADNRKARQVLDWRPNYTIDEIISHAWAWHDVHEKATFG